MTTIQIEKIKNRIKEIESFLGGNTDYTKFDYNSLFKERTELNFILNKQNIYVTLRGEDKYYNAWQCREFSEYIKKNGFDTHDSCDIDDVYFDKHSITIRLKSTGQTDIKRFETTKEMFSFVQGFNECVHQLKVRCSKI